MRYREANHSVSGDILHAMGKGFLIACAAMVLGTLFGGSSLVADSAWGMAAVAAAAISGAACMFASSLAHGSCRSADEKTETGCLGPATGFQRSPIPVVVLEGEELETPCEAERRFVERVSRQNGMRGGRGT